MESTKEIMSLRTSSAAEASGYRGASVLSVMATTSAPFSLAYCTALTVILEYRGKLIASSTSPGCTCTSCSKVSPATAFCTSVTFLKIRRK